jgi:nicotinate-nucleotide--dimethylbenzimidazole phosphoribosyltransferase
VDPVDLPSLDTESMVEAVHRQNSLIKPEGALGRLEALSIWLAGVQGTCPPQPPRRARLVVLAGDHGVARHGVSAYPPEVTAQLVAAMLSGGAAAAVLARQLGVGVRVEDISVDGDTPAEVQGFKVRRSSGRIDVEDAITAEEARQAFDAGRAVADSEVDAGTDLLVVGDLGIGNTTPCAVLAGVITATEPVRVVGRGSGIDDDTWMRKVTVVRDAMRRVRAASVEDDMLGLLAVAGGADLAATVGLLVQAGVRRTPVVLDGVVAAVCALVGERLAPGLAGWQVAGHRTAEPGQAAALDVLRHEPLLDLGLRLGEGAGALLALPLITSAALTLAEMATFEEAGVSGRDD